MKQELKLFTGGTITKDVDKLLSNIKVVCEKVEKAQDSYKSIIEDVYLLHYNKVHKDSGKSFYEYMTAETGMSKSTCASLVGIQKTIESAVKNLKDNDHEDVVMELRSWAKNLSMRNLLTLQHYAGNIEYLLVLATNKYSSDEKLSFSMCLDEAYDTFMEWVNKTDLVDKENEKNLVDKKNVTEKEIVHEVENNAESGESGVTSFTYQVYDDDNYKYLLNAIEEAYERTGHIQVVLSY